ncbi:MAG: threonine aldolase family protein [Bryobacteraceae bacterium]
MISGRPIDLRSDTVTRPTARMLAAMANAELGDDVYGEDPTVNRLEATAAEIFGKESALFVPTGTMGNTIAAKLHTKHGEEVICEARSHLMDWELSMLAWFSGCLARPVATVDGILTWDQIEAALRPFGPHCAPTTLVWLENTHNMAGGTFYSPEAVDVICEQSHARGLKVHMDGARVFNASAATGASVARIARHVDSVMFCLSKALGAPVGSMLVGTGEAIAQGRLYRKRLGGGMRQAGILAAAGLVALEDSPSQLQTDHANAQLLANRIASVPGIEIVPSGVKTNIVIFDITGLKISTADFSRKLKARGVLANGINATHMRMLTHYDVTGEECEHAASLIAEIAESKRSDAFEPVPTGTGY